MSTKDNTEIEVIDEMIGTLKAMKSAVVERDKLRDRAFDLNTTGSKKQKEKALTDLSWANMHLDQRKKDFARIYIGSRLEVSPEETEYKPSSFHNYKY